MDQNVAIFIMHDPFRIRIDNVMRAMLSEDWVTDEYDWHEDFLNSYFTEWFWTYHDCLESIKNNAHHLWLILSYVEKNDYKCINLDIPDRFNRYIYLYAKDILENDPNTQVIICDIIRIKHVRKMVPLVINRVLVPDLTQRICKFLKNIY